MEQKSRQNTLGRRTFSAFLWDTGGSFFRYGVTFLVSVVLARLLPPADFGLIGLALSMVSFANIFSDVGFSSAIIQKKDITEEQLSTVFLLNLFLSFGLCLLAVLLSGPAAVFFKEPRLAAVIQVLSSIFIITSFITIQGSLLRKQLRYKELAICTLIATFISGLIGIGMALQGFGVWSLVTQVIVSNTVNGILLGVFSSWKPAFTFRLASVSGMWQFGSNVFLAAVMDGIKQRIGVFFIGKAFTAADLGYYTRATSLKQISITLATGSVSKVLFPTFSMIADDHQRLEEVYQRVLRIMGSLIGIVVGLLFLISEDMIVWLITDKWLPSVPIFQIIILSALFFSPSSAAVNVIKSRGEGNLFFKMAVLKFCLFLLTIPIGFLYGIYAFLWAELVAVIVAMLINFGAVASLGYISVGRQFRHATVPMLMPLLVSLGLFFVFREWTEISRFIRMITLGALFVLITATYHFFTKSDLYSEGRTIIGKLLKR